MIFTNLNIFPGMNVNAAFFEQLSFEKTTRTFLFFVKAPTIKSEFPSLTFPTGNIFLLINFPLLYLAIYLLSQSASCFPAFCKKWLTSLT